MNDPAAATIIGECALRNIVPITSCSGDNPLSVGGSSTPHHYYIPLGSETVLTYAEVSHPHVLGAPSSGNSFGFLACSSVQGRDENHSSLSRGYRPGDQTRPIKTAPEAAGLQQHCEAGRCHE
ncbi:hypothetical protein AVEN_221215-1 [Araneus ventricosus]|uniref:Uncharacterized protein n=1 Tax=Araneus ventricosus TaxID=182803 RepID=A0A4Y2PIR3_ARAVE|nr:hypothetical protein AVEN_221215-1 [Araneus ventricosus]